MRDPQMTWLQENIGRAKGVLIAPEIVRAGFIFGGSAGARCCWRTRAASGAARVLHDGHRHRRLPGGRLGVRVDHADHVGEGAERDDGRELQDGRRRQRGGRTVGAGAKSDIVADMVAFTRAAGIYGGVNLNGTLVNLSDEWNRPSSASR